jgi:hypothetical protein
VVALRRYDGAEAFEEFGGKMSFGVLGGRHEERESQ